MENERDNNDGECLPPNEGLGTKNHDCSVPAIPSNTVQTMSMEIGKVGISDNGLKDITIGERLNEHSNSSVVFGEGNAAGSEVRTDGQTKLAQELNGNKLLTSQVSMTSIYSSNCLRTSQNNVTDPLTQYGDTKHDHTKHTDV